jgi:hypothetical protein
MGDDAIGNGIFPAHATEVGRTHFGSVSAAQEPSVLGFEHALEKLNAKVRFQESNGVVCPTEDTAMEEEGILDANEAAPSGPDIVQLEDGLDALWEEHWTTWEQTDHLSPTRDKYWNRVWVKRSYPYKGGHLNDPILKKFVERYRSQEKGTGLSHLAAMLQPDEQTALQRFHAWARKERVYSRTLPNQKRESPSTQSCPSGRTSKTTTKS